MKPEAVLKYAHVPMAMLGGLWEALRKVDWESIAPLRLDPMHIPPEVEMKAGLPDHETGEDAGRHRAAGGHRHTRTPSGRPGLWSL